MGKRIMCMLLIASYLLCLCGCQIDTQPIDKPVNFYYRCENPEDGLAPDVVAAQVVDGAHFSDELIWILNHYLSLTPEEGFVVTFPKNCRIISSKQKSTYIDIVMSEEFAQLSGLNLIIAATCIARTAADLTGIRCINLSASNEMLDGQSSLFIDLDKLVTSDPYQPQPEGR